MAHAWQTMPRFVANAKDRAAQHSTLPFGRPLYSPSNVGTATAVTALASPPAEHFTIAHQVHHTHDSLWTNTQPAIQQSYDDTARANAQRRTDEVEILQDRRWHVSDGWKMLPHHLDKPELWAAIVAEALQDAAHEPALASFLHTTIIMHKTPEKSLAFLLGNKLSSPTLLGVQLTRLFLEAFQDDPDIVDAALADIQAVRDRDPACMSFAQCLLYFKGFQAIQCHRVAHWMWKKGRKTLAIALQSRVSEVYHVDIHPGARLGKGILLDHATGVVVGETAVVGDNCVLLHHVTLGGSGTGHGIRHPNIGNGVLIGAGVIILGPVSVGRGSKIGAGSVVAQTLPPHCVAVGVPARVVRTDAHAEPVMDMDMTSGFTLDYVI